MNNYIVGNPHTNKRISIIIKEIRKVYLDRMISILPRSNTDMDASHEFISITEMIYHVFCTCNRFITNIIPQ